MCPSFSVEVWAALKDKTSSITWARHVDGVRDVRAQPPSFLPLAARPYGGEAGYVRQSSDALTLQRVAAPELHDAMRAQFFGALLPFCLICVQAKINRDHPQTNRWLLSIGYRHGDMIAHKPYKYFIYICTIKNALLVLEHVFMCVCAAGLILLSASVLLRVNASAQSLRNRIPPVLQTQTHTHSHTQIHTHAQTHTKTGWYKNTQAGRMHGRTQAHVSQLFQDKWCGRRRANRRAAHELGCGERMGKIKK